MNRTYLQLIAILMGTVATTFVAAEWRWEPAQAGNYVVIVAPSGSSTTDQMEAGLAGPNSGSHIKQPRTDVR